MSKPTFPDSDEQFGEFLLQLIFYVPMLLAVVLLWSAPPINFFAFLFQAVLGGIQLVSGFHKAFRYDSSPHQAYCGVVLCYGLLFFMLPNLELRTYNQEWLVKFYFHGIPLIFSTGYLLLTRRYITQSPSLDGRSEH